jgi:CHASE3 domain sensor protein
MNIIRKIFGLVWVLLAPVILYLIVTTALQAIAKTNKAIAAAATETAKATAEAARTNAALQWGIIAVIFLPIAIGLVIFGKYAFEGEYSVNRLQ